ncbi:MAG TPA: NAD(P)-dependent oxidoreductase, partial [Candidatus Omnitrophota bacterium]|nr:NAD(P)-dependent oxidoreductase [Candidatus Omnitrophota bacterium]
DLLEKIGSDSSSITVLKQEVPLTETVPLPSDADNEYELIITLKRSNSQGSYGLELTQTVKPKAGPAQKSTNSLDREFDGPVKTPSTVVPTGIRKVDGAKMTLATLRLEVERRIAAGLWKDPVEGYVDYIFWVGQNVKTSGARLAASQIQIFRDLPYEAAARQSVPALKQTALKEAGFKEADLYVSGARLGTLEPIQDEEKIYGMIDDLGRDFYDEYDHKWNNQTSMDAVILYFKGDLLLTQAASEWSSQTKIPYGDVARFLIVAKIAGYYDLSEGQRKSIRAFLKKDGSHAELEGAVGLFLADSQRKDGPYAEWAKGLLRTASEEFTKSAGARLAKRDSGDRHNKDLHDADPEEVSNFTRLLKAGSFDVKRLDVVIGEEYLVFNDKMQIRYEVFFKDNSNIIVHNRGKQSAFYIQVKDPEYQDIISTIHKLSGARLAAENRDPDTTVDLSSHDADIYALRVFRDSYLVKFEQKIDAGHSAEEALKKMDDMFGEKGDRKRRLETLSYLVYGEILTERELTLRIDQRKTEDLYVLKSLNRALNVVFKRAQRHGGKFTFKKLTQTYQSYLERHNKAQNPAPTQADIALLNRILNFVEGKMPLNAKVSRDVRIAVTDAMDDSKLGTTGVTNLSSVAKGEKLREALAQLKPHILIVRSATKVDEALIDQLLPDLKAIIRGGHGLDNVDADYARLMGIEVYGTQGSEHAVAAWALRAVAAAEQQGLHYKEDAAPQSFFTIPEWTQALEKKTSKEKDEAKKALLKAKAEELFAPVGRDTIESLKGKTIGIIGFGAVGRKLAAAAKELGMRVLVNTPTLEKDPLPALKAGYEAASKDAIYKTSHYIVPLTGLYLTGPRKNAGMIGQDAVDLMLQNENLIALVNPDREGL